MVGWLNGHIIDTKFLLESGREYQLSKYFMRMTFNCVEEQQRYPQLYPRRLQPNLYHLVGQEVKPSIGASTRQARQVKLRTSSGVGRNSWHEAGINSIFLNSIVIQSTVHR